MLTSRSIDYNGNIIKILMMNHETYIYELERGVRLVESANSTQVMYIDTNGSTAVITRDSTIYRELMNRVVQGRVVEDGIYNYQSKHFQ